MKKIKAGFLRCSGGIALFLAVFMLSACFSEWQGEGSLTINLGGSGARAVVDWPPYNEGGTAGFNYRTIFNVVLEGPTQYDVNFTFESGDHLSDAVFSFNLTPGNYEISIKQYIVEDFLYAEFHNPSVDIKSGERKAVNATMEKVFYDIGDTGPAGGIIYHVETEGFRLFMHKGDEEGIIAHYLEAAVGNAPDPGGSVPFYGNWGSYDFRETSIETDTNIGTGRRNTARMLATDIEAPAAKACDDYSYNGFDDWFLPSTDELYSMYSNLYLDGLGNFTGITYWSSSEYMSEEGTIIYFGSSSSGTIEGHWKSGFSAYVRPIRAF